MYSNGAPLSGAVGVSAIRATAEDAGFIVGIYFANMLSGRQSVGVWCAVPSARISGSACRARLRSKNSRIIVVTGPCATGSGGAPDCIWRWKWWVATANVAQPIAQFAQKNFPCASIELSLSHGTQKRATIAYFGGFSYNRREILRQFLARGDAACSGAHSTSSTSTACWRGTDDGTKECSVRDLYFQRP